MTDVENSFQAWVEVSEKQLDEFVQHLLASRKARKTIRFGIAVETKNVGSSVYGSVIFPDERVNSDLMFNSGVTANEPGNLRPMRAQNSQMTTDEIRGKNALAASANKPVRRDETKK